LELLREQIGKSKSAEKQSAELNKDDKLLFEIDRVKNFEVYFPHNNITTLAQNLES